MIDSEAALNCHATPGLPGCCEAELYDMMARILQALHDGIMEIGSDKNYYVVGLARNLPFTELWKRILAAIKSARGSAKSALPETAHKLLAGLWRFVNSARVAQKGEASATHY